ncbi:MAG: alpha/beta hydrolase-fold protein [Bacteroidota bacterium]
MKVLLLFLFLALAQSLSCQLDTLQHRYLASSTIIEVYLRAAPNPGKQDAVHYFTDGKKLLENDFLDTLQLVEERLLLEPAHWIFISTIDPVTGQDHRNEYFFCNPDYLQFIDSTLIPAVEEQLGISPRPSDRSLIGLSFGGLNAAYFSAHSQIFQNFALLSPVTYPCPMVERDILFSENADIRVWLSTGRNDAERYVQKLEAVYRGKGLKVEILETDGSHDFANWRQQIETILRFLQDENQ